MWIGRASWRSHSCLKESISRGILLLLLNSIGPPILTWTTEFSNRLYLRLLSCSFQTFCDGDDAADRKVRRVRAVKLIAVFCHALFRVMINLLLSFIDHGQHQFGSNVVYSLRLIQAPLWSRSRCVHQARRLGLLLSFEPHREVHVIAELSRRG